MTPKQAFERAKSLTDEARWDEALEIIYPNLKADPNNPMFLTLLTYILLSTNKSAIAYQTAKRAAQEAPKEVTVWLNLGMCASELWRDKEAIRYYKEGLRHATMDEQRSQLCVNICSTLVDNGDFIEGEKYAEEAIKYHKDTIKGRANLGFCQLAQRKWIPGWRNYAYCVGSEWRPRTRFNDEEDWDGKSKGTIAVWGEQGLGDEISFASMLPDMQRWCKAHDSHLIVECDRRLESLFKRSFPDVEIHGTRNAKSVSWDVTRVNYSIPAAQLGEHFRLHDDDFPGTPYLQADPDRKLQWKALFQSKQKPVIGLAWRSGIPKTAGKYRQLDLERLLPILRSVDAHWVSLQYKPSGKEIAEFREKYPDIDLVEYTHGTLSGDYDDTVAMIAAMDEIVCMHTTANHVAGGLGVPARVLVPKSGQWRYGVKGDDFIWAKSIKLYRQDKRGEWDDVINKVADDLKRNFDRHDVQQRQSHDKKGRTGRVQKGHKNKSRTKAKQSNSGVVPSGHEDNRLRAKDELPVPNRHDHKAPGKDSAVSVQAGG